MSDNIVRTITRLMFPFIVLFGFYIVLHGHISPGGGFSGGALIGSALILYTLVFGVEASLKKFSPTLATFSESGGILWIVLLGLIGLAFGGHFLASIPSLNALSEAGRLISGGLIPFIMIGIALKVTSTMISLFHLLIEGDDHV